MLWAAREALLGAVDAHGNEINESRDDLLVAQVVGQNSSIPHRRLWLVTG